MSIRRRSWRTKSGQAREAWIFDYVDQAGARHIETFARRKDADARQVAVKTEIAPKIGAFRDELVASGSRDRGMVRLATPTPPLAAVRPSPARPRLGSDMSSLRAASAPRSRAMASTCGSTSCLASAT